MQDQPIRGIVEVMDERGHAVRSRGLGAALGRLSSMREERGPVTVMPDREGAPAHAPVGIPLAADRAGMFRFSERAREAARLHRVEREGALRGDDDDHVGGDR